MLEDRLRECEASKALLRTSIRLSDWVFADPLGSVYKPASLSQAFRRSARAQGLKGVTYHSLRHIHATVLFKNGEHPKIVSDRLGHSSIALTIDTYSHTVPGLSAAAATAFEVSYSAALSEAINSGGPFSSDTNEVRIPEHTEAGD